MTIPQPFHYQGSKRALAPLISPYLPGKFRRLVDPFEGSGAMTLACAVRGRAAHWEARGTGADFATVQTPMSASEGQEEMDDCHWLNEPPQ